MPATIELVAKKNQDGSYSVSMPVAALIEHAFVDFYDDQSGEGYQRREALRKKRGSEIASYIDRCTRQGLPPRLFELNANARHQPDGAEAFEPLDDDGVLGFLRLKAAGAKWLSIIDGGTRLLGLENALAAGGLSPSSTVDLRVFVDLSVGEEIAQFLLINEKQKRVRTDLSLRVVQRKLDDESLLDREKQILQTVVPASDSWRFKASRLVGWLSKREDSPWKGLIKMPNEHASKPVKHLAFYSSLKSLLSNPDLGAFLEALEDDKRLPAPSIDEFFYRILVNLWNGIAQINPDAAAEPRTTVLWGSIGVNAVHLALTPVLISVLDSATPDLTTRAFMSLTKASHIADYAFWYTRQGSARPKEAYPGSKGQAPTMTGAAGYARVAKILENEWRAALHSSPKKLHVKV